MYGYEGTILDQNYMRENYFEISNHSYSINKRKTDNKLIRLPYNQYEMLDIMRQTAKL